MPKVSSVMYCDQAMELAMKPTTTKPTPRRCGKSFRTNKSRLPHTRHRRNPSAEIVSGSIGIRALQRGQAKAVSAAVTSARLDSWQPGQAKVTFMDLRFRL